MMSRDVVPWFLLMKVWFILIESFYLSFHYIYISVSDMNANVTYCVCYAVGFLIIEREKERVCDCKCMCVVKSNHKSKWKTINVYLDQNADCLTKSSGWFKIAMMSEYPPIWYKISYTNRITKIFLIQTYLHSCIMFWCLGIKLVIHLKMWVFNEHL